MHRELFHLRIFGFERTIYWYGAMVALGFIAVMLYWSRLARREGLKPGFSSSMAFWIIISGIVGARVAFVLANWQQYSQHLIGIIRIDEGGLVFYGGFIGGVLGFMLFALIHKMPMYALGDFAISGLPLGHAFGRVGCFLNGCCYGSECSLPWGVSLEGVVRHPVQLYEAGFNFLLFFGLAWLYRNKRRDGAVVIAYFLIYPIGRFVLEFWRGDPRIHHFGLTLAQTTSLMLMGIVLVLLIFRPKGCAPLNGSNA